MYFVFDSYEEAEACLPEFDSDKAKELRAAAERDRQREEESFQRCDTDGCVSQWCLSIGAQEKDREARLADHGYLVISPALLDVASGEIVAGLVYIEQDRFRGYGSVYKWHVRRDQPVAKQYRGIEYVSDYKKDASFAKLGLRKVFVLAPGRMYAQHPGDLSPPKRGLSGLASYSGKYAHVDYEASGLPK